MIRALDLTKACARAMGIKVEIKALRGTVMRYWFMDSHVEKIYDPLYDDAQALGLVKMHGLWVSRTMNGWDQDYWHVTSNRTCPPIFEAAHRTDLNRAICECVAKMTEGT